LDYIWIDFAIDSSEIRVMMNDDFRCTACGFGLPLAKSSATTWVTGLLATGLGTAAVKTWWARALMVGVGLAATAIVDELARPVCGGCGVRA
jgi:hypothetical protein